MITGRPWGDGDRRGDHGMTKDTEGMLTTGTPWGSSDHGDDHRHGENSDHGGDNDHEVTTGRRRQ